MGASFQNLDILLYVLIFIYPKQSKGPRKPRNSDQGLPHRKETGNLSSLSEIRGILVWVRVFGWFANSLNLLPT